MKNKKWFMNQLRKRLLRKFGMEDVKEILSDYEEFFDVASEKGKKEEEVVEELGDPRIIVKNIAQEWKQEKKKAIVSSNVFRYGIVFFGICVLLFFINRIKSGYDWGNTVFIILPFIFLSVWFLLKGWSFSFHSFSEKSDIQKQKTTFLRFHGCQVLLAVPVFIMILWLFFDLEGLIYIFHRDATKIGPFFIKCLFILGIIILGYSFWTISQFKTLSIEAYGLFFHGFTSIFMILDFTNILHRLSSLDTFQKILLRPLLIYVEGIILISLFLLLVKKMKKEVH